MTHRGWIMLLLAGLFMGLFMELCSLEAVAETPHAEAVGAQGDSAQDDAVQDDDDQDDDAESFVAQGEKLFGSHGCVVCHGAKGRGDGTISSILEPPPRDLADSSAYKHGSTLVDIVRSLSVGVEGSAMPSFGHISEQDRTAIAHYLVALQVESLPEKDVEDSKKNI